MVWLTGSGPGRVAKANFSVVFVLGSTAVSCSRGDDSNSRETMLGRLRFIDGGVKAISSPNGLGLRPERTQRRGVW